MNTNERDIEMADESIIQKSQIQIEILKVESNSGKTESTSDSVKTIEVRLTQPQ